MGTPDRQNHDPLDWNQALSGLIDRARLGSISSQNELFAELRNYLLSIAHDQLDNRLQDKLGASDIVQQSMIRAFENFGEYRGQSEAEFRGWLRKIVINETRRAHRGFAAGKRDARREQAAHSNEVGTASREPVDHNSTPATHTLAAEQSEAINRLIDQLPENYQTVIRLRNWEELSFEEIGQRMGMSTSGVAKVWYRALVEIQRLYQAENDSRIQ